MLPMAKEGCKRIVRIQSVVALFQTCKKFAFNSSNAYQIELLSFQGNIFSRAKRRNDSANHCMSVCFHKFLMELINYDGLK